MYKWKKGPWETLGKPYKLPSDETKNRNGNDKIVTDLTTFGNKTK